MPSLVDSLRTPQQLEEMGYQPSGASNKPYSAATPSTDLQPGLNVFLRCPLPPVWTATPDTIRQFYQGNQVPQIRLFNPDPVAKGGGSVTNITNVSGSNSTSSGGSTTASLSITSMSVQTTSLTPGSQFVGSFDLSKAFELLSLSATSPCRVRMYGSLVAQSADLSRALDTSPPAGTGQNIICDVVLDTAPLLWNFQNREGANADNPVTSKVYLTVTNLDAISDIVTLSFSYIPIVS